MPAYALGGRPQKLDDLRLEESRPPNCAGNTSENGWAQARAQFFLYHRHHVRRKLCCTKGCENLGAPALDFSCRQADVMDGILPERRNDCGFLIGGRGSRLEIDTIGP
ncbi:hypothetical protein AB9E06_21600 [Rhizobium leguminosarum]|uniref:hypothetical protein n=1 Tax=Rhizobium leguminosarum TaxID=384 RepID=UPI003F9D6A1B